MALADKARPEWQLLDPLDPRQGEWGGAAAWRRLYDAGAATAYLSPEWTVTWLRVFGADLRTRQWDAVADGSVIGTCLMTERRHWAGLLALRRLHLNTDGENREDRSVIEHNGVLADAHGATAVYAALADCLERSRVDEVVFAGAREEDLWRLCEALPGWHRRVEWRDAPYVDLAALRQAGRSHVQALSRNTRSQLARALRLYEARGPVRLERARTVAEGTDMFEGLVQLHEARWLRRRQAGGFATSRRLAFHRALVRTGVETGRVHLLRVWCGDTVIGILYNLVSHGHVAFYQSGFLYDDDPRFKPGLVTHHLAVEHYLAAGLLEYDFLPSAPSEDRYKRSLATASRRLGTLTLARPSWRGAYFGLVRALRQYVTQARRSA